MLHLYSIQPEENDYLIFELFGLEFCESLFDEAVENDRRESGQKMSDAGRRAFTPLMMGMIFLVMFFRNWSYARTAKEIKTSLCLRAWLRLGDGSKVPKAKTIWRYSQIFIRQKVCQKLFNMTLEEAKALNPLYGHSALAFDSTYVLAPIQRNDKATWDLIKAGRGNELWNDFPQKKIHKDIQAAFSKKNSQLFFGYKAHMTVCLIAKLIFDIIVTPANVHDAKTAVDLIARLADHSENVDEHGVVADGSPCLFADAGYFAKALVEALIKKGYITLVCSKAKKGEELTESEKEMNHEISRIRVRIEHVFAFLEKSLGGLCVRTVGLERAEAAIFAKAWIYNKLRLILLSQPKAA
ncbi:MAG: IS5 family transposase [Burkholderiales bacterium]|nr:IS5 family transposase [Burkholderiales bacterium]